MIPRKIHYCWFGPASKNALNHRCLASWRGMLSDYEIKEWNEANSLLDVEYCRACHAKGLWSRLSNYVRMYSLYTEGGMYLDVDVEVIRSFDPLLSHKCFLGFQQQEEQVDWVNSAVMGAVPGHLFLKACMDRTVKTFAESGEFYRSPTIVTALLKEMGLAVYGLQEIGDVAVYPAEYFYPYPWYGRFSPDCVTGNTHCIHYWEAARKKQKYGRLLAPLRKLKRLIVPVAKRLLFPA
jgi:hypothetical protein